MRAAPSSKCHHLRTGDGMLQSGYHRFGFDRKISVAADKKQEQADIGPTQRVEQAGKLSVQIDCQQKRPLGETSQGDGSQRLWVC